MSRPPFTPILGLPHPDLHQLNNKQEANLTVELRVVGGNKGRWKSLGSEWITVQLCAHQAPCALTVWAPRSWTWMGPPGLPTVPFNSHCLSLPGCLCRCSRGLPLKSGFPTWPLSLVCMRCGRLLASLADLGEDRSHGSHAPGMEWPGSHGEETLSLLIPDAQNNRCCARLTEPITGCPALAGFREASLCLPTVLQMRGNGWKFWSPRESFYDN